MYTVRNDFEPKSSGKIDISLEDNKGHYFCWYESSSCSTPLGPTDLVGFMSQMYGFNRRILEAAVGVVSSFQTPSIPTAAEGAGPLAARRMVLFEEVSSKACSFSSLSNFVGTKYLF